MDRRHKPHPNAKPERNRLLFKFYNDHPEIKLDEIAKLFEISKTRVCAIVKVLRDAKC